MIQLKMGIDKKGHVIEEELLFMLIEKKKNRIHYGNELSLGTLCVPIHIRINFKHYTMHI